MVLLGSWYQNGSIEYCILFVKIEDKWVLKRKTSHFEYLPSSFYQTLDLVRFNNSDTEWFQNICGGTLKANYNFLANLSY
jgi:hypothetical protein